MLSDKKNMATNKIEVVKHISDTAKFWTGLKNLLNNLRCKLWIQIQIWGPEKIYLKNSKINHY